MTPVRAASSATLSVAVVPRRAAVLLRVAHREVVAQEEALREAVHREVLHRESLAVAAVAPAVMMTTIITHHAAVAVAAGDSFSSQNRQNLQNNSHGNMQRLATACRCFPRLKSGIKTQMV
jgi:hypothetical protein